MSSKMRPQISPVIAAATQPSKFLIPEEVKTSWVIDQVLGMKGGRLRLIAVAVKAIKADRGSSTPSEEFITSILNTYNVRALRISDVVWALEEFKGSIELVEACTRSTFRDDNLEGLVDQTSYLEKD